MDVRLQSVAESRMLQAVVVDLLVTLIVAETTSGAAEVALRAGKIHRINPINDRTVTQITATTTMTAVTGLAEAVVTTNITTITTTSITATMTTKTIGETLYPSGASMIRPLLTSLRWAHLTPRGPFTRRALMRSHKFQEILMRMIERSRREVAVVGSLREQQQRRMVQRERIQKNIKIDVLLIETRMAQIGENL